uniref:Peptidase_M28 domain-containing protein n=1 Tax=Rhabditophanes sp. KR3021 TaxID=114890 RepID=A0AC35TR64_9BILA
MVLVEAYDILRPFYCILILMLFRKPSFVFGTSDLANLEVKGYRLQQYDIGGVSYGSRGWKLMHEGGRWPDEMKRRCFVVFWTHLINGKLNTLPNYELSGLIIIVPSSFQNLSASSLKIFKEFETKLKTLSTPMAIYFIRDSAQVRQIAANVDSTIPRATDSYWKQIFNSVTGDSYFIATKNQLKNNSLVAFQMTNIIGKLACKFSKPKTILIVAYYDSNSVIPGLSNSVDSNGSGVVALIELMAVLKKFYFNAKASPRYDIVFMLSAGGKFNYQGSRNYLDNLDDGKKLDLVICLDSIGKKQPMNVHLSKLPSDKTAMHKFIKELKAFSPNKELNIIRKPINRKHSKLAWEHEIYNMKQIPAFTLSHYEAHDDPAKDSVLDESIHIDALKANIKTIAESLLSFMFNLPKETCNQDNCSILSEAAISTDRLQSISNLTNSMSRAISSNQNVLIEELSNLMDFYTNTNLNTTKLEPLFYTFYDIPEDTIYFIKTKAYFYEPYIGSLFFVYLFLIYNYASKLHDFLIYLTTK